MDSKNLRHITSDKDFVALIAVQENRKGNLKKNGWDAARKKWFPYNSTEGGTDTTGYGHKMPKIPKGATDDEITKLNTIMINKVPVNLRTEGLTEEQARWLLNADLLKHERIAQREYSSLTHSDKREWVELSNVERNTYTEIAFNIGTLQLKVDGETVVGEWGWPSLTTAMVEWDKDKTSSNLKEVVFQISRKDKEGRRLGRVKPIREYLTIAYTKVANPAEVTAESTDPSYFEILDEIPNYDKINKGVRARFLRAVMLRYQEERNAVQAGHDRDNDKASDLEVMLKEVDDRETEERASELVSLRAVDKAEDEETLQRESAREEKMLKLTGRLETLEIAARPTDKVIDVELADVQYFQKPDGSVIKVDSTGAILE